MPPVFCPASRGIMIRGIERRKIFRNNKDREDFIERLEYLCPEMQTTCYAWAFMSNHAHFLFRTGTEPLSRLMRRLLTGYVIGFNRRHNRRGQLFQNVTNLLYARKRLISGNWSGIFTSTLFEQGLFRALLS